MSSSTLTGPPHVLLHVHTMRVDTYNVVVQLFYKPIVYCFQLYPRDMAICANNWIIFKMWYSYRNHFVYIIRSALLYGKRSRKKIYIRSHVEHVVRILCYLLNVINLTNCLPRLFWSFLHSKDNNVNRTGVCTWY